MAAKLTVDNPPTEVFRALSDPIRWSIIVQMAQVDELACITLESTLPVSKPTISYHTKILQNAGPDAAPPELTGCGNAHRPRSGSLWEGATSKSV